MAGCKNLDEMVQDRHTVMEEDYYKEKRVWDLNTYEKYKRIIYQTANNVLHDYYLAEDVVQETMLVASKENVIVNYDNMAATGWFITVARNIAINVYNRRKRELLIDTDQNYDDPIYSSKKDILEEISEQNNYLKLKNMIDTLPNGYSNILYLRYVYDYNYDEIATIQSINCGTARKRVQRAKLKLSKLLNETTELT